MTLQLISDTAKLFPALIVGDMQCDNTSRAFQVLTNSYLQDARTQAEALHNAHACTYTGFVAAPIAQSAWPDGNSQRLDHVLSSGFHVHLYGVSLDVRKDNNRPISTHRAVYVDVDISV